MSANQSVSLTIADIAVKHGTSKKGAWALATITGSDNNKYKTFDVALTEKAKQALGAGATVEILFTATDKTFKNDKGEQVPYVDREIKDLVVKNGAAAPAPQTATPAPAGLSNEDWILRDRVEFRRRGAVAALETAAQIMAAGLSSNVETYKFDDAMRIVKAEAKSLYATYFKPLEGGSDEDPDTATDAQEEAEVVE